MFSKMSILALFIMTYLVFTKCKHFVFKKISDEYIPSSDFGIDGLSNLKARVSNLTKADNERGKNKPENVFSS